MKSQYLGMIDTLTSLTTSSSPLLSTCAMYRVVEIKGGVPKFTSSSSEGWKGSHDLVSAENNVIFEYRKPHLFL